MESGKIHEEKLEALLHLLPVGISILNKERKPIYTNLALEKILKLANRELQSGKYSQRKYLRGDGSEMPISEFPSAQAFDSGQAVQNVEVGVITEDGDITWTMVSAVPLLRDDWQVILTVVDITERKQARYELQSQTSELVSRLKELNCLYRIADLVERPGITLEEILQETVDLLPSAAPIPEATGAQIMFKNKHFMSPGFRKSTSKQHCPIVVHGKDQGVIEIFFNSQLDEQCFVDQNFLNTISERLGRISERFIAEAKLNVLATTDSLTGLYNRRHFFYLANTEIERAKRYGSSLSCIMFDIDHFKYINDLHGHLIGDQVLQKMVGRCQNDIRQVDIFARYGGDEFVLLLPETNIQQAEQMANRINKDFQHNELILKTKRISVTLSMGVATMNGDKELILDTILNRADQALYHAKEKGRNRISVWSHEDEDNW